MARKKHSAEDIQEARAFLLEHMRPLCRTEPDEAGERKLQKVYFMHRHTNRAGDEHTYSVYVVDAEGDLLCLDWAIRIVCDWPTGRGNHGGVRVSGGGMDMRHHLLDWLCRCTFSDTAGRCDVRGQRDFRMEGL